MQRFNLSEGKVVTLKGTTIAELPIFKKMLKYLKLRSETIIGFTISTRFSHNCEKTDTIFENIEDLEVKLQNEWGTHSQKIGEVYVNAIASNGDGITALKWRKRHDWHFIDELLILKEQDNCPIDKGSHTLWNDELDAIK